MIGRKPIARLVRDRHDVQNLATVGEYTRRYIERLIITGRLKPSDRVGEAQIAESLGISRSPVREAFKTLQAEGFLEFRPRRGVVVAPISLTDIWEVYSLQCEVYVFGLSLAWNRIGKAELGALRSIVEQMESIAQSRSPDIEAYQDLNHSFHYLPINLSGHRRLMALANSLHAQVKRFSAISLGGESTHLVRSARYHRRIYDCIERRDLPAATERLREHVDKALALLTSRMAGGKSGTGSPKAGNGRAAERNRSRNSGKKRDVASRGGRS